MRGPLYYPHGVRNLLGNTPACAGTTKEHSFGMVESWDHPRMCGDHCYKLTQHPHIPRITPACAGTTPGVPIYPHTIRDHPRMCGDHFWKKFSDRARKGSPPHVRGPLSSFCSATIKAGITPACAGTTIVVICYIPTIRDHPRMCGDHYG